MNEGFDWPIPIILIANSVGLLVTILWALISPRRSLVTTLIMMAVFGGTILINVLFPEGGWTNGIGRFASAFAVLYLLGFFVMVGRQRRDAREKDQAVLDDFRSWSGGGDLGQKNELSGFAAYASRDRGVDCEIETAGHGQDPVCPNCGTVYNRQLVISLIKQQSPELFDFQTWSTKFVCKQCRHEIAVSGP